MAEKYLYGPFYGHTVKNPLTNDPNDFFSVYAPAGNTIFVR